MGGAARRHKSLFDAAEVGRLLRDAGYASYVVCSATSSQARQQRSDLNLGFYASAEQRSSELERDCRAYLAEPALRAARRRCASRTGARARR